MSLEGRGLCFSIEFIPYLTLLKWLLGNVGKNKQRLNTKSLNPNPQPPMYAKTLQTLLLKQLAWCIR